MFGRARGLRLSRRGVVVAVLAAALAARALVFMNLAGSPLELYSKIDGLDMKTIAAQGEAFARGDGIFTAHRAIAAFAALLSGGCSLDIKALALIQMAFGAAAACILASCAMRLTASRLAGLVSGLLAASYSPELLYETLCLKESLFYFMGALTLWTFLAACVRRRSKTALFAHGAAAALLPLARFAGILWSLLSMALLAWKASGMRTGRFKLRFGPASAIFAGAFAVWLLAAGWDMAKTGSPLIFESNVKYNLRLGSLPEAASYDIGKPHGDGGKSNLSLLFPAIRHAPAKFLSLLRAYQPTDNVNYYFMKGLLPALELLPGPMLLVPLGASGLLLMILRSGIKRRPRMWIAPAQFMAFAIPVCMFVPTGRYMLALAPAYAIGSGFAALSFVRACAAARKGKGILEPCLIAGLLSLAVCFAIPSSIPIREADFTSLALALQMKEGPSAAAGEAFRRAIEASGGSQTAAVNFGKWLIDAGKPAAAAEFLRPFQRDNPSNFKLLLNFTTALNLSGGASESERSLEAFAPPDSGDQRAKYFINLGVAKLSQGRAQEAAQCFSDALASASSEGLKATALELLKLCAGGKPSSNP